MPTREEKCNIRLPRMIIQTTRLITYKYTPRVINMRMDLRKLKNFVF